MKANADLLLAACMVEMQTVVQVQFLGNFLITVLLDFSLG